MKRNVTITLDESLVRSTKVLAAKKDTSVSQLLAQYLKNIIQIDDQSIKGKKEFLRLTQKKIDLQYAKRTFSRDTLHER